MGLNPPVRCVKMTKIKELDKVLEGERVYLRSIGLDDVNETYCRWMNDSVVNKYLESRFYTHYLKTLKDYVCRIQEDKNNVFFAIILKDRDRHIGNIKLGPINTIHRFADIGILIGEKDCWGKGYATDAIRLVVEYAFNKLNLHKVTAGCYAPNKGSLKAFKNAGFSQEGVRKNHCYYQGEYVDDILLGLVNSKFKHQKQKPSILR
jgi:RimJ/RimL family protein N-acetyltransferase